MKVLRVLVVTLLLLVVGVMAMPKDKEMVHGSSAPGLMIPKLSMKELIYPEDNGIWLTAFPQENGILNWLTPKYLHRVLVTHKSRFEDIATYQIPNEYQSSVALFTRWDPARQSLHLVLVPFREPTKLIEVSLTFKISLSAAVAIEWDLLRELRIPQPDTPRPESSTFEWKYLLSSTPATTLDTPASSKAIKELYLVGSDKVVVINYKKWKVQGIEIIPLASIFAASVHSNALYLASYSQRREETDVYQFKTVKGEKEVEFSKIAIMPNRQFHQLSIVRWDNTPMYLWLHNDISTNTDTITIHQLQSAIEASHESNPVVLLSGHTSIIFNDEIMPDEMLIPHGPLHTNFARGGFILRKLKTRPSPSIGEEAELYDLEQLPQLGIQLQPKKLTGRIVFGSLTNKDAANLFMFTYGIAKDDKEKGTSSTEDKEEEEQIEEGEVKLHGGIQKLWKLGAASSSGSKNTTSVPIKIVASNDPSQEGYNDLLPFSCKQEGCGPDVKCPSANPTRNCFLYNSAFLCCHQSPFS